MKNVSHRGKKEAGREKRQRQRARERDRQTENSVGSKGREYQQSFLQHNCHISVHFTAFRWKQLFLV